MQDRENLAYYIALSLIPRVSAVNLRKLVVSLGSAEAVFSEKKRFLVKVPGIGDHTAESILNSNFSEEVEKELDFIDRYNIKPLYYHHPEYPNLLKECEDAPILIYRKGNHVDGRAKSVAIVGTRNATSYGKSFCEDFVKNLAESFPDAHIVSGLAFGIDIAAHRAALKYGLNTTAVLAHSLDRIYPDEHRAVARKIVNQGALITEYTTSHKFERNNFIRRNRIIAGMADATIVVESGRKGGAMVTADIANSYNRDVFALPGRVSDTASEGCNLLIKTDKGRLIESFDDFCTSMCWDHTKASRVSVSATSIFELLNQEEKEILNLITKEKKVHIDHIASVVGKPVSVVSPILLGMEFKDAIKSLPGKMYSTVL